jgi:ABC-type transporter Mla subunit MlaD
MAKTLAQILSDAQVMNTGLKTNLHTLQKRGMSQEFIDLLEGSIGSVAATNAEQERLKADLKTATAALETRKQQLNAQMQEAVKVVKLEIPQSQWKEFGIQAKK